MTVYKALIYSHGSRVYKGLYSCGAAVSPRGTGPPDPTERRLRHDHAAFPEPVVFPRIGNRPVSEVASVDVLAVLTPIWHVKVQTVQRVRHRIRAVLAWAGTPEAADGRVIPARRHSTLGQISPAAFERRANEEGVDPMENRQGRGFPQAPHPLSFSMRKEQTTKNDQLNENVH